MKRIQNTLYINTQKTYVYKDNSNIVISLDKKDIFRVPIHLIQDVVCFGNIAVSPFLMGHCCENNVGITFCNMYGRFICRVAGKTKGNVLLRRAQHSSTQSNNRDLSVVRSILVGKILNSRLVLQRFLRDHCDKLESQKELKHAVDHLSYLSKRINVLDNSWDTLRGLEGDGARTYFGIFESLILKEKDVFIFKERNRRPPKDPVNALLSFAYTILCVDYTTACEAVGLDPQMGFLHADRPGRVSLALDLMEELRACFSDRIVLSLINRQQIKSDDFTFEEGGGVLMTDNARKIFLETYQKKKQEEVLHPFLNEKVQWGLIPLLQARLLASYLRGDLDAYPPFFWR